MVDLSANLDALKKHGKQSKSVIKNYIKTRKISSLKMTKMNQNMDLIKSDLATIESLIFVNK